MYATDYFVVKGEGGEGWRLVTPYLEKGTLEMLAGVVRRRGLRPGEVDAVYRERFRGVLGALKDMHDAGYVGLYIPREERGADKKISATMM